MLSCSVHLVERERNIMFGSRNTMFGWRNIHKMSLIFYIPRTFHIPLGPSCHTLPCGDRLKGSNGWPRGGVQELSYFTLRYE